LFKKKKKKKEDKVVSYSNWFRFGLDSKGLSIYYVFTGRSDRLHA
jgi:hypothetical protein